MASKPQDSPVSSGPSLAELGLLKPTSGGSGGEGQVDFADFLSKAVGGKISMLAKLSGGALPNLAQLGEVPAHQGLDSNGIKDAKMPGLAAMNNGQDGVILKALKTLFADGSIKSLVEGVGGNVLDVVAMSYGESGQLAAPAIGLDKESSGPSLPA